jgi:hypothetical protein
MAENKTRRTGDSVAAHIASRASPEQKTDVRKLMAMMRKLTGKPPRMWGPSIVGYDSHEYSTAGGRTGQMPRAAFAIRGRDLVVYIMGDPEKQKVLLAKLGKHSMGKSCLYFRRLADIDPAILEKLVAGSIAESKRRSA